MTRIALFVMWLLHWLPLPWLASCGRWLGRMFQRFGKHRRHIVRVNVDLCFPKFSPEQKSALARRHFEAFGRSFLERGLLWWASPERIRKTVQLDGLERLNAVGDRPVILLAPHFVGLDMGWTRLAMERDMVTIYAHQTNPVFDTRLRAGRLRFGQSELLARQEGTRRVIKAMKAGKPFYYLPDMDYGKRDILFVPFFGVPAATITGLSRLARMTGALVLPVITRMTEAGYIVEIGEPWPGYPGESIEIDTVRMNAFLEAEILKIPEQYFWLHRRFKTRPPGEKRPY